MSCVVTQPESLAVVAPDPRVSSRQSAFTPTQFETVRHVAAIEAANVIAVG
jgi:hypothetical protein